MSCFDVQILDPNISIVEIETCIGDQPASIDVVTYDNTSTVEINHCVALLPSELNDLITVKDILSGSGIGVSDSSGIYTISLLDPTILATGILETVQDIIGNSGLLGGNYISINYDDNTGFTTVSATGLQPSGNYSVIGHTHTSLDITDFNTSVSGLLPIKNIIAGSGIGISSSSGNFTVSVTGTFGLTGEEVDDRVSGLLVAGTGINLNYDDNANTLIIQTSGLQPSGNYSVVGHTHLSTDITDSTSFGRNLLTASSYAAQNKLGWEEIAGSFTAKVGGQYFVKPTPVFILVYFTVTDPVSPSVGDFYTIIKYPGSQTIIVGGITYNNPILIYRLYQQTNIDLLNPTFGWVTYTLNNFHTHTSSEISDFNSAVSGLIPIHNIVGKSGVQVSVVSGTTREISTNFIAGNGIAFNYNNDESLTISTITNNGLISISNNSTTSLTIPSGYIIGSLSIYQNGVKLLDGIDYTATDGNSIILSVPPTSGSYIEYATPTINSNIQNLINASITGLQPSGNYSVIGHTHTSNEITNFNSSVSGLLPSISGSGYIVSSLFNNTYTISVTGLQPSGNYSTIGHSHTLSDITNVNTIYDTNIYDLGTISGTYNIDYGTDRMIQTFSINTNSLTLNKGSGWPTSYISRDVLLQVSCINPAPITWNIVGSNWYNQPVATLPSGEYLILLRAMGSGTIQGHYIGEKEGAI